MPKITKLCLNLSKLCLEILWLHFFPDTVYSTHRHYTVKVASKVGKFSNTECSIISCLGMGIFVPKNSIVTKFCHLAWESGDYVRVYIILHLYKVLS